MEQAVVGVKELVFVGGGHSHVIALKKLIMNPIRGLRITLISDVLEAPYSGMLPGYLGGFYEKDQLHFDLFQICQKLGVRFILGKVTGVNPQTHEISVQGRPNLSYDVASINVGSEPLQLPNIDESQITPLKPISQFLSKWEQWLASLNGSAPETNVAMVGGGASGIEVLLMVRRRMEELGVGGELTLIHKGKDLLPGFSQKVKDYFRTMLDEKGIRVLLENQVTKVSEGWIQTHREEKVKCQRVFWATQSDSKNWFRSSGLPVNEHGFLKVDKNLQVQGVQGLFAAGDCIEFAGKSLPRAGVFAVRQGPILAHNINSLLLDKSSDFKSYRPQKTALALLTTGEKRVVGVKGPIFLKGEWLWTLKDFIDRSFMEKFQKLPLGPMDIDENKWTSFKDESPPQVNHCGGCGSKIGPKALRQTLDSLSRYRHEDVLIGMEEREDSALIRVPEGYDQLQSVDFFRSFISDPYVFGTIATCHSLTDIYAMGGIPYSAMAMATFPPLKSHLMESDFRQVMAGALDLLAQENVALIGGHTVEGDVLSFGLSVSGLVKKEQVLTKGGVIPGDYLVLTRPVGTGVLFAESMYGKCRGRWVYGAMEVLKKTHRDALEVILRYPRIQSLTDVTGFGLAGHLLEMLQESPGVGVQINYQDIPKFPGAEELYQDSGAQPGATLVKENVKYVFHKLFDKSGGGDKQILSYPLMYDPQTAGGLLLAVSKMDVEAFLKDLKIVEPQAAIIGQAVEDDSGFIQIQ